MIEVAERIEGLKDLQKKLSALGPALGGKALRNATSAAMLPVLRTARASAPVGSTPEHKTHKGRTVFSGFLRRSVARRSYLAKDKMSATAVVGVKAEAYYGAQFVELGTSRQPRQPWLTPAMYKNKEQIVLTLRKKLKLQIDKARRK